MLHRPLIAMCLVSFFAGFFVISSFSDGQTRRNIKVGVDAQQSEQLGDQSVQGSSAVIVRRGTVNPSGRISANERQTTVQRRNGIFTLVRDGSESILTVATRVPQSQVSYYYNYAIGAGYLERRIVFNDVGTSLRVNASIVADGQVRLRLTPRISYFAVDRPGAIDFTEAATELIVPNGEPVSLGGASGSVHELTRQILGYRDRTTSNETQLTVTATVQ
jgi:type II/III secretion system protein